jgi:hypothetical protein
VYDQEVTCAGFVFSIVALDWNWSYEWLGFDIQEFHCVNRKGSINKRKTIRSGVNEGI